MDSFKKYNQLITKMNKKHDEHDTEIYHKLRDEIYEKFIKDINSGKIKNIKDAKAISKKIKEEILDKNYGVWFS